MNADFQRPTSPRSIAVGDFELTVLSDGNYRADGGAFFGVVPKPLWGKLVSSDAQNRIVAGLNSILVRTGRETILIETGIGPKLNERLQRIYEPQARLMQNLAAAGVSPEEVDIVINTHLHFDHCGWNTVRERDQLRPAFPRATYYVQQGELQHARLQLERDRVSYLAENYEPLVESGRMRLLRGDAELVPGISVCVFPGHTAGMQAVIIRSGGATACYISDLIPTSAHLNLTWVMAYDLYPLQTIESRKRFYELAIPGDWLVLFTHDPVIPWAKVKGLGGGKYVALPV
ncbi:MAG: MBL fold metallo-hydrolase [Acidobacteria bacterium]|nr:MBL fold metallo-hydrolase [Acidobacteriota bacterium]